MPDQHFVVIPKQELQNPAKDTDGGDSHEAVAQSELLCFAGVMVRGYHLYPQTIARFGWNWKVFWTLGYVMNPNACWDWWGYDHSDYYTQRGSQITAIRKMLDRLTLPRR